MHAPSAVRRRVSRRPNSLVSAITCCLQLMPVRRRTDCPLATLRSNSSSVGADGHLPIENPPRSLKWKVLFDVCPCLTLNAPVAPSVTLVAGHA